jgi:hypothetical protein
MFETLAGIKAHFPYPRSSFLQTTLTPVNSKKELHGKAMGVLSASPFPTVRCPLHMREPKDLHDIKDDVGQKTELCIV